MTSIKGKKHLFFVTSPRTPLKMVEEIKLLVTNYSNQEFNKKTQINFAQDLKTSEFFDGRISESHEAFSARDRITRAPKALGIVDLKPTIRLTEVGEEFINSKYFYETFTRQLMKFQFPSPYHTDEENLYSVKPYLELLRMVYELRGLSKDEIALFFMELTHYEKYEEIKENINNFREEKAQLNRHTTSYKRLLEDKFQQRIPDLYEKEIREKGYRTRENSNETIKNFIKTKKNNHYDYADAAMRYMRTTLLCTLHTKTYKLIISDNKFNEVEFLLNNVARQPIYVDNIDEYKTYLFNPRIPELYTDNRERIEQEINDILESIEITSEMQDLVNTLKSTQDINQFKYVKDELTQIKLDRQLHEEIRNLKTYEEHEEIINTFEDIGNNEVVDAPLFMEWNVWRGMTMLNDGNIKGNFRIDDDGLPLSTAGGNLADIECDYENFNMIVEVTLSSGNKQYEMEGEPVARHLGKYKALSNKESYCLFIAKKISEATLAHFFFLNKISVNYYGGKSKIVPLELEDYKNMLTNAKTSERKPNAGDIKSFMEEMVEKAQSEESEVEWKKFVSTSARTWLD